LGAAPIIVLAHSPRARGPPAHANTNRRRTRRAAPTAHLHYMAKQDTFQMDGVVTEVLPDRNYRVKLENGHQVLAYAAGRMSKFNIRVLEGDRVTLDISPYDLSRGRITYRHK
jgi:translation initiation factor IF-1